jgi:hypothetical protein
MDDPVTIQKIATEIVGRLPGYPWGFLAVQIVLTLLAAGIGAFFGEYLRARGKHLATRADFNNLQDQLRANTELVEAIKSDVGQRDWVAREWRSLRRSKLEQLLEKKHDCDEYLDRYRDSVIDRKKFDARDEIAALETIVDLYFPELRNEASAYISICRAQVGLHARYLVQGLRLGQQLTPQPIVDQYLHDLEQLNLNEADRNLRTASANLLRTIMGV